MNQVASDSETSERSLPRRAGENDESEMSSSLIVGSWSYSSYSVGSCVTSGHAGASSPCPGCTKMGSKANDGDAAGRTGLAR